MEAKLAVLESRQHFTVEFLRNRNQKRFIRLFYELKCMRLRYQNRYNGIVPCSIEQITVTLVLRSAVLLFDVRSAAVILRVFHVL